jgi:hypothetical protein
MKYLMKSTNFWIIIGTDCLLVCAAYVLTNIKKYPGKIVGSGSWTYCSKQEWRAFRGRPFFMITQGKIWCVFALPKKTRSWRKPAGRLKDLAEGQMPTKKMDI